MKIIALMNEKGGSGKSTLATNLATALLRQNRSVTLIDTDPQGTVRDWKNASPEDSHSPPVIALDRPQMLSALSSLTSDIVIIDTPAKSEEMAAHVIRIAHSVLIVIQPSGADIWAASSTVKLIQQKLNVGGSLNVAFVVNRTNPQTKISQQVQQGDWNEYAIPQLNSTIKNRVVFAQALTDGLSVYDLPDKAAHTEIDALVNELEGLKWL